MAPTAKLPPKPAPAASMTTNSGLGQRPSTRQNPVNVDTANSANQLDSAFDNSGIKTNIIVTLSNIDIP